MTKTKAEEKAIILLQSKGYKIIQPEDKKEIVVVCNNVPSFDEWWDLYDKKCGKKKAEEKWNKLTPEDRIACYNATPAYVASVSDKQFQKHPLTYLNGECWNDEIIQNRNGNKQTNRSAEQGYCQDTISLMQRLNQQRKTTGY